jgi:hypothetical protein
MQVGQDTLLRPPSISRSGQKQDISLSKRFTFDASYCSVEDSKVVATQEMLFDNVGRFALDNALKGS